jgi:hypothetical protein
MSISVWQPWHQGCRERSLRELFSEAAAECRRHGRLRTSSAPPPYRPSNPGIE